MVADASVSALSLAFQPTSAGRTHPERSPLIGYPAKGGGPAAMSALAIDDGHHDRRDVRRAAPARVHRRPYHRKRQRPHSAPGARRRDASRFRSHRRTKQRRAGASPGRDRTGAAQREGAGPSGRAGRRGGQPAARGAVQQPTGTRGRRRAGPLAGTPADIRDGAGPPGGHAARGNRMPGHGRRGASRGQRARALCRDRPAGPPAGRAAHCCCPLSPQRRVLRERRPSAAQPEPLCPALCSARRSRPTPRRRHPHAPSTSVAHACGRSPAAGAHVLAGHFIDAGLPEWWGARHARRMCSATTSPNASHADPQERLHGP